MNGQHLKNHTADRRAHYCRESVPAAISVGYILSYADASQYSSELPMSSGSLQQNEVMEQHIGSHTHDKNHHLMIQGSKGRNGPRSQNGCWTCRTKKVKCDEKRPLCDRCARLKLLCDYSPRLRRNARLLKKGTPLRTRGNQTSSSSSLSPTPPSSTSLLSLTRPQPESLLSLPVWPHPITYIGDGLPKLSIYLPELSNSASSLNLSSADHEAIRYFRTTFAKIHHTKNPDYSLFSIIFKIAEREPIVMCVLLALAGQEVEFRRGDSGPGLRRWMPLQYYSAALGLLADTINRGDDGPQLDIDTICAVLYLMLLYEQKYGDSRCAGLSNHLTGTARILQHRCNNLPAQIVGSGRSKSPVLVRHSPRKRPGQLSLFSGRMLVWIALCDASAATFGLGGQVNSALRKLFGDYGSHASPVDNFGKLHNFTNSLYRNMWGEAYPQSELLDDVENRMIFALTANCSQLRYLVSELYALDATSLQERAATVWSAIQATQDCYCELLEVAGELSTATDNSQRLVANIRGVVPLYHAVVLEFLRSTRDIVINDDTMELSASSHMSAIMNLAYQGFKYGGHEAMTRIAWPLFVVALETNDLGHRDWILSRFQNMSHFGQNLERAHRFLGETLEKQARTGYKIDPRAYFQSGEAEMFVI